MQRHATPITIAILLATAGTASADPQDIFDGFIVRNNEDVSFQLKLGTALGDLKNVFEGDPASVRVGTLNNPVSVGRAIGQTYDINVGWDEFFDVDAPGPGEGFASRIRFDIATSDGSPFASADDFNNGFSFIQWEIGDHLDAGDQAFADPIDFRQLVTQVLLVEATAVFFDGDQVQNTIEYGFTLDSDWDGTDAVPGNIFSLGATTNRIELTYDYTPIPAPASVALLAGSGMLLTRRRRA